MKKLICKSTFINSLLIALLCTTLFSFSEAPGAHSFEISLNNNVVLQGYINDKKEVPTLSLNQEADRDQLSVNYNHCGQMGTARSIIIKDGSDKVLKVWNFDDDTPGVKNRMTCKVKDIVGLSNGNNSLNLFYSSKELTKDQILASIQLVTKTASNK